MKTNVFYVLPLKRIERPNDALVAWLCDPREGHGVPNFAATIIRHLWDQEFTEPVTKVTTQCTVGPGCIADIEVQFARSVLVIENKVNRAALQEGQLERYHEHLSQRKADRPFHLVLLCADHLRPDDFVLRSDSFRVLKYSKLSDLIEEAATTVADPDARFVVRQYAQYARLEYGSASIAAIRAARRAVVAAQEAVPGQRVSREQFTNEVERESERLQAPELLRQQTVLIELLDQADGLHPIFEQKASDRFGFCYKVHVAGTKIPLLRVCAHGRMWTNWNRLIQAAQLEAEALYRARMAGLVNSPELKTHSELISDVSNTRVDFLVKILQEVADKVIASGAVPADWLEGPHDATCLATVKEGRKKRDGHPGAPEAS